VNRENALKLFLTLGLVIVAAIFLFNPIKNNTKLGLDLQGGVHVVLQAVPSKDNPTINDNSMAQLQSVMDKRVNELGISEPVIQREGKDRLIVELAGVNNPEAAIDQFIRVAKLEFKDEANNVILGGKDLKDAQFSLDPTSGQPEISLIFTDSGKQKFADATSRNVNRRIAIILDGKVLTNPNVQEPILNGQARITGGFTNDEAAKTAALLRAGALPVDVTILEKRTVGPTLGMDSLNKSVQAAIYGLSAIILFMLVYYRIPGLVATFSLVFYTLLLLGIMISLKAVLTLPGIAGFLLSIAIAVDANIIIFERLKEELRAGKTLFAAMDAGFNRAFWTIFDSNITTILVALVLYLTGTGAIRGFAITLILGIATSMFTAFTFTRWLLKFTIGSALIQNTKMYGK
jgi:preprotein translocase subunit SecD